MEPVIIDHTHREYKRKWQGMQMSRHNGAFYYSREIVQNIIPAVETDRSWVTINIPDVGADHAIVFIHNNLHPENYDWLRKYDDLILVCGVPETVSRISHLGTAIYLPLSVDVEYVQQFRIPHEAKDIHVAYVGRSGKRSGIRFPRGTVFFEGMPRAQLLRNIARCHKVYAVGRAAIEAKILDCEVLPYDSRFPDPGRWRVMDNEEAAKLLQKQIDEIDKWQH